MQKGNLRWWFLTVAIFVFTTVAIWFYSFNAPEQLTSSGVFTARRPQNLPPNRPGATDSITDQKAENHSEVTAANRDVLTRLQELSASLKTASITNRLPIAELITLARQRRDLMKELMVHNPEQAIAESLSFADYAALPTEVQQLVERPFSLVGRLQVLPVCGDFSTDSAQRLANAPDAVYEVQASGTDQRWQAYLQGRRAALDTKEGIALQGFTLDGAAAVRNEVLQVLNDRDATAARDSFGMRVANADPDRDFLTGERIRSEPVTAAAGGRLFLFANRVNADRLNDELARMEEKPGPHSGSQVLFQVAADPSAAADGFNIESAWQDVNAQSSAWTESKKTVFIIRVDFPDMPGEPVTQAAIGSTFNTSVSDEVLAMSYGKTWIEATASSMVVRMPQGTNYYLPSDNSQLYNDAETAFNALATGVKLTDYDIVVVAFKFFGMSSGSLTYAGLAGGGSMWLQGSFNTRVITHELGHCYGLGHAKFWMTSDGSVVGAGTSVEYGDVFDIMGSGPSPQGHYHVQGKSRLNWLTTNQWTVVTNSGTFRIYRLDDPNTTASTSRGLRITKATSPDEYYWVGYRRQFTDKPYLSNGAYLIWQRPNETTCHLLDTTPGSADGKDDSAILIGRTYSDTAANVYITPVDNGGTGPDEWLDVTVNEGSFPGNRAPDVTLTGPTNVAARTTASYTVTGSDPDGDELAYSWNFGDGPLVSNAPAMNLNWAAGGQYSLEVAVSDMKGQVVTRMLSVTVTDPLQQWTSNSLSPAMTMRTVTYGNGRFVALGNQYSYLSFDGVNWESMSVSGSDFFLPSGVAEGAGRFVAVGRTYSFSLSAYEGSIYSSSDGRIWERSTIPSGNGINSVAYGNGVWVAAGNDGRCFRSTNSGVDWSAVNVPATPPFATNTLSSLAYGNGTFVAVGETNVFTSTDGLNWEDHSDNTAIDYWQTLDELAFANGRFFAGGFYAGIVYSDDNGQNWQAATMPANNYYTVRALVAGDGWLMAAADLEASPDFPPVFLVSQDGSSWSEASIVPAPDVSALAFGSGRAVGVLGAGVVERTDALYPDNHAPSVTISGPTNTTARTTALFTATGSDLDGDTVQYIWDFGAGLPLQDGPSVEQNWQAGGTYLVKLIATDARGGVTVVSNTVVVSDPLASWTPRSSGTTTTLYDICVGTDSSGTPIAVTVGSDQVTVCYSTNGSDWTKVRLNEINSSMHGVVYDGQNYLACGWDYAFSPISSWIGVIWSSPDAINWTRRYEGGTNTTLEDIATSERTSVAVGAGGLILCSTNGGTNWFAPATTAVRNFSGVTWGAGTFVAVGGNSDGSSVQVFTSTNGVDWTDTSSGAGVDTWQNLRDVQYCNDRFLASGWYSKIRSSTNAGVSFETTRTSTEEIPAFAYGNGVYFAAGIALDNGSVDINLVSSDGANWVALSTPSQDNRRAAVFFQNTFITVGDNGTIMQSDVLPSTASGWDGFRQQTWPGLPAGSGFTEDYDLDGWANGLEYALGTDPRNPASKGLMTGSLQNGYPTLTVQRAAEQSDINYLIERSIDLKTWSTNGTSIISNMPQQLIVRSLFQGLPTEFLRLKVEQK